MSRSIPSPLPTISSLQPFILSSPPSPLPTSSLSPLLRLQHQFLNPDPTSDPVTYLQILGRKTKEDGEEVERVRRCVLGGMDGWTGVVAGVLRDKVEFKVEEKAGVWEDGGVWSRCAVGSNQRAEHGSELCIVLKWVPPSPSRTLPATQSVDPGTGTGTSFVGAQAEQDPGAGGYWGYHDLSLLVSRRGGEEGWWSSLEEATSHSGLRDLSLNSTTHPNGVDDGANHANGDGEGGPDENQDQEGDANVITDAEDFWAGYSDEEGGGEPDSVPVFATGDDGGGGGDYWDRFEEEVRVGEGGGMVGDSSGGGTAERLGGGSGSGSGRGNGDGDGEEEERALRMGLRGMLGLWMDGRGKGGGSGVVSAEERKRRFIKVCREVVEGG